MLENQLTYRYIAQAPTSADAYGAESYGTNTYSCASTDTVCLTGGPSAPNTGFLASSNPVLVGGIVVTIALVVAVATYAILAKVKQSKAAK